MDSGGVEKEAAHAAAGRAVPRGVAHVVQRMEMGGIQTLVLDLLSADETPGYIISLEGTIDELVAEWSRLSDWSPQMYALNVQPGVRPGNALAVRRVLRSAAPRAVVLHHIGPLLYGGIGARLAGVPRIIHVEHDIWHYDDPGHRRIAQFASKTVRPRHIAVSDTVAEGLQGVVGQRPVRVIFPGIDMTRFCPRDRTSARVRVGLPGDATIVGTVGRIDAVKGHRHLVDALAQLPAYVHVAIVGDGPDRRAIEARAGELGVAHRLHMLGQRDDVAELLSAFDVFSLPSLNEGLPRAILEAQAVGLPVVATEVGAIPTAIDLDAGALVPPGDGLGLATAIKDVLDRPPRRNATRAFVAQAYSLQRTAEAFSAVIAA